MDDARERVDDLGEDLVVGDSPAFGPFVCVCLSVCLSVYLPACLSVCLSICLPSCLSVCRPPSSKHVAIFLQG